MQMQTFAHRTRIEVRSPRVLRWQSVIFTFITNVVHEPGRIVKVRLLLVITVVRIRTGVLLAFLLGHIQRSICNFPSLNTQAQSEKGRARCRICQSGRNTVLCEWLVLPTTHCVDNAAG